MTAARCVGLLIVVLACAQALLPAARDADALQALLVRAVERALAELGRPGGFDGRAGPHGDVAARLGPLARALHGTGMGARVVALEDAVRRASERALAEAGPWLREEAARFAPSDPGGVLASGAAAAAFRATVEAELAQRLAAAAASAAEAAGVAAALARVREGAARLPLPRAVALDPARLVNEHVRDTFFAVLAEEEARLRSLEGEARAAASSQGIPHESAAPRETCGEHDRDC